MPLSSLWEKKSHIFNFMSFSVFSLRSQSNGKQRQIISKHAVENKIFSNHINQVNYVEL